jgi:hypothetical protein
MCIASPAFVEFLQPGGSDNADIEKEEKSQCAFMDPDPLQG